MTFRYSLLLILAVLLGSCTNPFHPRLKENETHTSVNASPEAVLQGLEQSYRQKNLQLFEECFAPDFRFELLSAEINQIGIDVNGDGIKDDWWGLEQELDYTRNLFQEGSSDGMYPPPDQINLRLIIPDESTWENDTGEGHQNWLVIPCLFDLQLLYTASGSSLTSNGVARFYLKPVDGKWYIAIWRDESNI